MDSGARGYVLKSDSDVDLVRAVEALGHHKPFFTSRVTEMFRQSRRPSERSCGDVRSPHGS